VPRELRRPDETDRGEVLDRVVGQLLVDSGADGERRHRREKQRVAIRRRFRDRACGDQRAGANPVVDNDRPLELVLQLSGQEAHQDVGAAAGRKRTDEGHGPAWIIVSLGIRAVGGGHGQSESKSERSDPHGISVPCRGVCCLHGC
jgi:hypothetical protein